MSSVALAGAHGIAHLLMRHVLRPISKPQGQTPTGGRERAIAAQPLPTMVQPLVLNKHLPPPPARPLRPPRPRQRLPWSRRSPLRNLAKVRAGVSPAHCVLSRQLLRCPAARLLHAVVLGGDMRAAYAHSAQACCSWALQIATRCLGAWGTRLHDAARVCGRACTRTPRVLLLPAAAPASNENHRC